MKQKHIEIRKKQCSLIASASTCCRRKVGALIVDPKSNVTISEGYNGPPRENNGDLHLENMIYELPRWLAPQVELEEATLRDALQRSYSKFDTTKL